MKTIICTLLQSLVDFFFLGSTTFADFLDFFFFFVDDDDDDDTSSHDINCINININKK